MKINFLFSLFLVVIIVYSIFVRAQGLGYSNFQGDEVNPMTFLYGMDNGVVSYLLEQKRAPMQYVINMLNVSIFGYNNEGQIRFPFLIFGIAALYTLYKLASRIFDKTVALLAVSLMAINGLFIAFARITQYQSFMYFLIPIGILIFIKAIEKGSARLFVYSGLVMSIVLLTHFDTVSVVPFFVVGFVRLILKNRRELLSSLKNFAIFFLAFLAPALIYYIPYFLHSAFGENTSGYLEGRLFGGGLMPRTQITLKLLAMYVSKFHLYTLFFLGVMGLLLKTVNLDGLRFTKISISRNFVQKFYILLIILLVFASELSLYPVKPRLSTLVVLATSLAISFILAVSKKTDWKFAALTTWFLGSYSFYFYVMKDPRTHVYVSLIPLFILAAYGFNEFIRTVKINWLKYFSMAIFVTSVVYISGINWVMFVDRSPEYPWWDKTFLGNPIYKIKRVRYEKIEGVFGFNSYRAWERVADLYKKGCLKGTYNSNEKDAITYFYIRQHQKQGGLWELQTIDVDNIIIVQGPHSWVYTGLDDEAKRTFLLLKEIYSPDYDKVPVSYIYGHRSVYPDGKLLCD